MKVLSRSRWPLPPKVRTGEGGSKIQRSTVTCRPCGCFVSLSVSGVRCRVARAGHQGKEGPDCGAPSQPPSSRRVWWVPPKLTGDRPPRITPSITPISAWWLAWWPLGWQPLENRGNLTPLQAADQGGPLASVLCQSFTVLVKTVKLQALALTLTPYEFHQQLIWNKTSSTQLLYCVEGHQKFMRLTLKKVKILFNLVLSVVNWPTNV